MKLEDDRTDRIVEMIGDYQQNQIALIDELTAAYKRESYLIRRIGELENAASRKRANSPYMKLKRKYWRLRKRILRLKGETE